jgi:hypothetical protein
MAAMHLMLPTLPMLLLLLQLATHSQVVLT